MTVFVVMKGFSFGVSQFFGVYATRQGAVDVIEADAKLMEYVLTYDAEISTWRDENGDTYYELRTEEVRGLDRSHLRT